MKPIVTLLTVLGLASFSFGAEGDAKKPEGEKGKPKANPEEAFKKLDKDADGSVSLEEFKASPRGQKEPAKAEEYFKKKDKDSNGKLTLEEFKAHAPKPGKKGAPDAPKADAPKADEPKPEAK